MNTKLAQKSINGVLIGNSKTICEVKDLIIKAAKAEETTLITGETGTGKEIAANLIYKNSSRNKKPFIVINCAAIPEGLAESELFGYEKGTFTNAIDEKDGKFIMADGGVIFLDEICSLSYTMQGKILRALQEKEIQKIGSTKPRKINVFVIAATNTNLLNEVKKGRFRADLFYRLNILNITLPPLRDRKDDLELLIDHFLTKYNKENNCFKKIHDETMQLFKAYSWPGNVRELENLIKRIIFVSEKDIVSRDSIPLDFIKSMEIDFENGGAKRCLKTSLIKYEKEIIEKTLHEIGWNISRAAEILNLDKNELNKKLKMHAIEIIS